MMSRLRHLFAFAGSLPFKTRLAGTTLVGPLRPSKDVGFKPGPTRERLSPVELGELDAPATRAKALNRYTEAFSRV
jgi:hypothetical protein